MAQSRRFWTLANSGRRTRVSSAFGVIGYQLVVRFEAITTIC